MCLLVVLSRLEPGLPLVVAANRDERYERPAVPVTVLRPSGPRILGGRDLQAGGTWLAVNEHGVVAGLTNRPTEAGRDPSKRSRGVLPLAMAERPSAEEAVAGFEEQFDPSEFNPFWLLVADRSSVFYIDMTASKATISELPAGMHVLENQPLAAASPKVAHVRRRLDRMRAQAAGREGGGCGGGSRSPTRLFDCLRSVLADHTIPEGVAVQRSSGTGSPDSTTGGAVRPLETSACCVHTEAYGTRSASLVTVAAESQRPELRVTDGHPCTAPMRDAGSLWKTAC